MQCRFFEEQLSNDAPLSIEQRQKLETHTLHCSSCAALMTTDEMLRHARMLSPADGFAARFETRLTLWKAAERRRKLLGIIPFSVLGFALLFWLAWPYLDGFLTWQAQPISAWLQWGAFLFATALASLQASLVVLGVLANFLTPLIWMAAISGAAGLSLISSISTWRLIRASQGTWSR
ncbi:MAG: hypothetical protein OZ914_01720 [Anaerolineaceae bacterium]|nr:hypothetical protein [Anaerolineaceae bacterium]